MKRSITLIVLVLSAILIFTACGSNNNAPAENNANTNQEEQNTGANNENPGEENTENTGADEQNTDTVDQNSEGAEAPLTVAELQSGLTVGTTQEDTKNLLGEEYFEVSAATNDSTAWRYDIGASSDYTYEDELDTPDMEGLKNGDVSLQVFVYFDAEGNVSGYSAYEANEDGTINAHQLLEDGSTKVEVI